MIALGHAFIVPVVIDDTPEDEAQVPDLFTKAQFTRLTHGAPPEFVTQVKRPANDPAESASPTPPLSPRPVGPTATAVVPPKKGPVLMIFGMSSTGVIVLMAMRRWFATSN